MMFSVTTLDEHKRTRQFSYQLASLGANLDFIHQIRNIGHSVLSMRVIDRHGVSDIPLEASDDELALQALDQLEAEWKAILAG